MTSLPIQSRPASRPPSCGRLFLFVLLCLPVSFGLPVARAQLTRGVDASVTQTGSVEGTLTGASGKSVTGVTVSALETGATTTVDAHGHYTLSDLVPGTYTLIASGEGFSRLKITDVVVKPSSDTTLSIEEMPVHMKDGEVQTMEEVVVSAKKDVETMEKYVVTDQKPQPFTDRNVDIPRGIDDVQPYYIINSKTIEQSGALNVEDLLKERSTMVTTYLTASQTNGFANSGTLGVSSGLLTNSAINLRGLGSNQTLILIDGRRSAVASLGGTSVQPDINGIPLASIDRIEILPSGASAIYGGSAVSGVINIILKKDYQGGEINTTYESTWDGHAPIKTLDGVYGFNLEGGKTRVMISAHYSDQIPLLFEDRAGITRKYINQILANAPGSSVLYSSGLPDFGTTPNLWVIAIPGPPAFRNGTLLNAPVYQNGFTGSLTYIASGTAPGSDPSVGLIANGGRLNLNFAPGVSPGSLQNPFGNAARDKSLAATVHHDLSSRIEAFTEFTINSNSGMAMVDPLPVNSNYLLTPTAPGNIFNNYVFYTIPNRLTRTETSDDVTRTVTAGLIVRLPDDWRSEMDYTWSQSAAENLGFGRDNAALTAAINNGTVNPFVDTIAYPPNLDPYVTYSSSDSNSTVNDLALRASGPVATLPWGKPTLTFSLEHQKAASANGNVYNTDPATSANSFHLINFAQSQSDNSAYAELQIPIVTQKNGMPLLRSLEFQVAARDDSYTVSTGTPSETIYANRAPFPNVVYESPTLNGLPYHNQAKYSAFNRTTGLSYKPVDDLMFRVSYATAFLPPTPSQLLPNPLPDQFPTTITDPQNSTTYSVQTKSGGNPNLTPEKSKSWDAGVVYEPKGLLEGLRLNIEYYQIEKDNTIGSLGAQQIVSGGSALASRVRRDPATGLITLVDTSLLNLFKLTTQGWDISADYRKKTGFGTFELFTAGTAITHFQQQTSATTPLLEYAGYVDSGGPGKLKANATLTWEIHNWTVGWTTTYFGSYYEYASPGDPVAYQGAVNPRLQTADTAALGGNSISSQMYHELFASYRFDDRKGTGRVGSLLSNMTLQIGVKDIFNKAPPLDPSIGPYYYSAFGDPRMRDFWIRLKKAF